MDSSSPTRTSDLPESLQAFLWSPAAQPQVIAKVNYSHKAMIDEIVRNPHVSQGALAAMFGYTPGWISQVIATDAFQAALHERKEEIIDPVLKATVEERLKGLVLQSIEKLKTKLEGNPSDDLTLGVMAAATKALGYGAKNVDNRQINNFVVQVPGKAATSESWAAAHRPSASGPAEIQPRSGILPQRDLPVADAEIIAERSGQVPATAVPTQQQAERILDAFVNG